ncbi:uncharacterized protein LOC143854268 [Tasmannia lanceolata]|uniref:uncharacterized protein LOC143854268 n=1 Tax=Tasmannia lanceolata TaxID=3420 RepID=UPI0040628CB9
MSKKKSFSRSTMTLKDFHGGSIPSDLPLPSAPGIMVKPSDRQNPMAWGNPVGRSDHRLRPGSSGSMRTFDDKSSFLSQSLHIGRNFDEDERKPFDGASIPRRLINEDPLPQSRPDPKPSNPVSHSSSAAVATKLPVVVTPSVASSQFTGAISGQAVASSAPNAWGARKDVGVAEPVPSSMTWSGPSAVSKFAQASALEKIQSGRWQSKPSTYNQPDVEVIRYSERESDAHFKDHNAYNSVDRMNDRHGFDVTRGRYGERDRIVEDVGQGGGKEFSPYERVRSPVYPEAKERNLAFYPDGVRPEAKERNLAFYPDGDRPDSTEGKLSGSQSQSHSQYKVPAEASERPKLKLLPRTKLVEPSETHVIDNKQGYHQPTELCQVEIVNELYGNSNPSRPGSTGTDGVNQAVERPKLNLKPRSQPIDKMDGSGQRERKTLFGGARPRELVLKDRGVDDTVINNVDSNRVKHDVPKADAKAEPTIPTARQGERPENFPPDQRIGREAERKDHRPDAEKTDVQRISRRNDNPRRNGKETEKHQEQQRRQEPDSWRKPIEEPPKLHPSSDAPGSRHGRAASALELAQAFSRSISDTRIAVDRFTTQSNLPGRNQARFSRLTGTREFYSGAGPRQINGY